MTQQAAPSRPHINIAFVTIENDARYEPVRAYERIILKAPQHPLAGAELGIDEAAAFARVLNADITLDPISVKSPDDVTPVVLARLAAGTHFFLLDAPAEAFGPLAAAVRGRDALIFNVSTPDDALRRDLCAAEFVHVYPSRAQLMDGLVQFVISRKWRDLLVLQGAAPEDAAATAAFTHSAQKFGARIVAQKTFKPGTDPRKRDAERSGAPERRRPRLRRCVCRRRRLRFRPHRALSPPRPRPVIGAIDLEPVAWHWTWERNGAPQVNSRFDKKSGGRRMEGADWASWLAVKMIVQSALRTHSADFAAQRAFILGDGRFDGAKGLALSVRPWDHQVRQAILLAAPYEVVADAPIEGFLHQTNELDTLGDDAPETPCHLDK